MARFPQVGGARARWPSAPPGLWGPRPAAPLLRRGGFEIRSRDPRPGRLTRQPHRNVDGCHYSAAVALSVSGGRPDCRSGPNSLKIWRFFSLTAIRARNRGQFSLPSSAHPDGYAIRYADSQQRQDEPKLAVITEPGTRCINRVLATITLLGEEPHV